MTQFAEDVVVSNLNYVDPFPCRHEEGEEEEEDKEEDDFSFVSPVK